MNKHQIVHLFHIFFVGGLFLYVGIQKTNLYLFVYTILLLLGFIIIFYHLYKLYLKLTSKNPNLPWVNLIHILFVGPLLLSIGYQKEKTSPYFFELLLLFGFASIGYHGYSLFGKSES